MSNAALKDFFAKLDSLGLMVTYDDVRLRTKYSEVLPPNAVLGTALSKRVRLHIPVVSSAMDTVTESRMAIAMAEAGGIGIIHRGLSPEAQALEVRRVKRWRNARIEDPVVAAPEETVATLLARRDAEGYGWSSFPVVDEAGILLGLMSGKDFELCTDASVAVASAMTTRKDLLTATPDTTPERAYELMRQAKKKVLPLVDTSGKLAGLYIFSDLRRLFATQGTQSLDAHGQLLVGAAVGAGEKALARAELLAKERCDVFHIDTAHGDSKGVLETIAALKEAYPHIDVLAGNVSSGASAKRLADAGADAVLVGQGPGSICTTRVVAGVGVPQVSAIYECATALEGSGVPVIADGGINNSGDMVIALAVGASAVMLGRLFAGTEEAPGDTRYLNGMQVKDYRGMGSQGAMLANSSSRERYGQASVAKDKLVPEGIEGIVPYKGPVSRVLTQYTGGIRAGMGYLGAKTLEELRANAELFRISGSGLAESHPHDITITGDAPNYERR